MTTNGHSLATTNGRVLRWPGRVLSVEGLRSSLRDQGEVVVTPGVVVTPLAEEHLRERGVTLVREETAPPAQSSRAWGLALDRPYPLVESAVRALAREGTVLRPLGEACTGEACGWARRLAECVARGECPGGVVFCQDPALVCCVANKVAGLRAAAVVTMLQAARATLSLGANLLAVEMPGRTWFEVRQILRDLGRASPCPPGVACTLTELDGHAHR